MGVVLGFGLKKKKMLFKRNSRWSLLVPFEEKMFGLCVFVFFSHAYLLYVISPGRYERDVFG